LTAHFAVSLVLMLCMALCQTPGVHHQAMSAATQRKACQPPAQPDLDRRCVFAVLAAGNIACTVGVANTGTVRLTNVQLSGPSGSCTQIGVLAPGDNITTCVLNKAVIQAAFDAQEADDAGTSYQLMVTAAGASNVASKALTVPNPATTFTALQLPVQRTMTVSAAVSKTTVTTAGKHVRLAASK
jgi:hypothetical protein